MLMIAMMATAAFGQLRPTAEVVDFGAIYEKDGEKTVRFYVVNTGDSAVSIRRVRPSCGCTAADFDRLAVAPGDSAWIDLTYNPFRRPGRFEKNVRVYSSEADGEALRIPITGTVFASEETIANMFPVDAGALHLSERTLMPARPLGVENKTLYLDVYNSSDRPVKPVLRSDTEAVETECYPEIIPPGDTGTFGIYLKPSKESRRGPLEYILTLDGESDQGVAPTEVFVKLTIDGTSRER